MSMFTPSQPTSIWRRLGRQFVAWVVGAGTLFAAGAALAEPPGRVGRVAETEGTVWMADEQRGEWVHAQRNSPITDRDRVSVSPGSRAVIQIGSATLRLDGDTEVEVLQLDDRNVRLQLHGGSAALQLPMQDSAREFEIVTAEGRFMPRLRGHYRVDRRAGTSMLTVWDGALRFESEDSELDVREGQRVDFWSERGRTNYATATLDRDAFTDWVVASERRYGQLAQRHVSPEMTGAYDLDQYGAWDTHPQYGAVWYPRTVASDWAPYRYGRWSYVSPWGWTWVDDAPWGFAPFHYGRWVNWRGRWCWTPGGYVARPVYAPALVAWFGGPNVSVGVNLGGAPHVGWVALSPFEVFAPWYAVGHAHLTYINVNPWRHMHGYHDHRHDDYANRHHGAVVVVPQSVVVERRPIRQDVITPAQASIWRGDRAPPAASTNGVAIRIPAPPQPSNASNPGNTTKTVGRGEAFVPPAPVKTAGLAPPPKTPNGRDVPWVRGGRAGGVEQGAPVVAPAPNVATAPARAEPRVGEPRVGQPRVGEPAPSPRTLPPGGKTWRDEAPAPVAPVRPVDPRPAAREARDGRDAGAAMPLPRPGEGRPISIPQQQHQPQPQVVQPRTFPRDDDDRGRMPPATVHRAPPVQPVPAPAPVVVAPPAQQVHIQRPPMPQVQPMPQPMPQPHVQQQPRPRPQDRDDDRGNGQRRGGPKDERGGMLIK